jgi:hypothetical protein
MRALAVPLALLGLATLLPVPATAQPPICLSQGASPASDGGAVSSPAGVAVDDSTLAAVQEGQTPGAVWAHARAAYQAKDFRAYYRCMSPDTRYRLIMGDVMFFLSFGPYHGNDPPRDRQQKDLKALFARYGVRDVFSENPHRPGMQSRKSISLIADAEGLYAEVMTWMMEHDYGCGLPVWHRLQLGTIEAADDRAVADLVPEGTDSQVLERLSFLKIDDAWYIEYPLDPEPAE